MGNPKIANDAVNDAKLAGDSVGSTELKAVSQPQSGLVNVPAGMENGINQDGADHGIRAAAICLAP